MLKEEIGTKVREEFFRISKVIPFHPTNRLEEKILRKSRIFDLLTLAVFDNPHILKLLSLRLCEWLKIDRSEFIYVVAGYIYYLQEDFLEAEKYFLKAISLNPDNLDNWYDLAFSLYHQDNRKFSLAKEILFNFDRCIRIFRNKKVTLKKLEQLLIESPLKVSAKDRGI
jgi:tetratricopeptide (TPR) repeat protein